MNPAQSERVTVVLKNQPVRAIVIAAQARQPIEDGYPISGDMIATMKNTSRRHVNERRDRGWEIYGHHES